MIVETLNSVYEIDGNKVRRLEGKINPTPRQGKDGEWKTAELIGEPVIDQELLIVWAAVNYNTGETVLKSTLTSPIVKIGEKQ